MYVINSVGLYCILFVKIIFIRDKRKKNILLIKVILEVVIICFFDDLYFMYYEISSCLIIK